MDRAAPRWPRLRLCSSAFGVRRSEVVVELGGGVEVGKGFRGESEVRGQLAEHAALRRGRQGGRAVGAADTSRRRGGVCGVEAHPRAEKDGVCACIEAALRATGRCAQPLAGSCPRPARLEVQITVTMRCGHSDLAYSPAGLSVREAAASGEAAAKLQRGERRAAQRWIKCRPLRLLRLCALSADERSRPVDRPTDAVCSDDGRPAQGRRAEVLARILRTEGRAAELAGFAEEDAAGRLRALPLPSLVCTSERPPRWRRVTRCALVVVLSPSPSPSCSPPSPSCRRPPPRPRPRPRPTRLQRSAPCQQPPQPPPCTTPPTLLPCFNSSPVPRSPSLLSPASAPPCTRPWASPYTSLPPTA